MLQTYAKRSSTNPFGIKPTQNPAAGEFNFDKEGLSGWRTNNWIAQMDTLPWLQNEIMFQRELQPQKQDAVRSTIQRLQNPQANAQAMRANRMGSARDEGFRVGQMLAQSDPSSAVALQQGAQADAANRASDQSSAFDAYLQSPQGQQEALMAIIQAITGSYDPNALNAFGGLTNIALNTDRFNLENDMARKKSGGGLGGILGSVLGMATGGGWGNILGSILGGGGGGGSAPIFGNSTSNEYGLIADEWGNVR